jgi:hypothetical protein
MLLFVFSPARADPPGAGCQPHQQVNPALAGICRQNAETLKKKKNEYEELLKKKTESMQKSASAFAAGDQTTEAAVENAKRMFSSTAAEQEALIQEVEKKRKEVGAVQQNYEDNLGKMLKSKASLVNEINQKTQFIAHEKKGLQELQMGRDPNNADLITEKQKRISVAEAQLAELNKKRTAFDSAISADRASQGQAKVLAQKFKVSESELHESATKLRGHHARLSGVSLDSSSQISLSEKKAQEEVTAERAKLADMSEKEGTNTFNAEGKPVKPSERTGTQKAVGAALAEADKADATPNTTEAALVNEGKQMAADGKAPKYFTPRSAEETELMQAEQSLGTAKAAVKRNEEALAAIGGDKGLADKLRESSKVYSGLEGDVEGMPKSDTEGLKMAQAEWRAQYEKDCKNPAVCAALNSYGIKPEMSVGTGCVGSGICGVEKKVWDANSGLNDIPVPTNGEQVVKTENISQELRVAAKRDDFEADASSRLKQMNADTMTSAEQVKKNAELAVVNRQLAQDSAAKLANNEFCQANKAAFACAAVKSSQMMAENQAMIAGGETVRWDPISAGQVSALANDPKVSAQIDQNVKNAAKVEEIHGTTETMLGFTPVAGSVYSVNEAGEKVQMANAAVVRTGGVSDLAANNLSEAKAELSSAKTMLVADAAMSATGLGGLTKGGVKAGVTAGETLTSTVVRSSDNLVAPIVKNTDNVAEAVVAETKVTTRVKDDLVSVAPPTRVVASQVDEAASMAKAQAFEDVRVKAYTQQSAREAAVKQQEAVTNFQARLNNDVPLSYPAAAPDFKVANDNVVNQLPAHAAVKGDSLVARVEPATPATSAEVGKTRGLQLPEAALRQQQEANLARFQTQLNDNSPLSYPKAAPEFKAAAVTDGSRAMPQPPAKIINAETVPEVLTKNNIPHTTVSDTRALVTPGPENKVTRTAAKVENKYGTKTYVDEAVDDADYGGWANKDELTLSRRSVTDKVEQGPLLSHEVEHVKNTSNLAKRVDEGQTQFDWRNITFGSANKPTGIQQYDQMAIDEVMAYRRSYNQYRFDANAARKAGDNATVNSTEIGAESAAYQYGEKLRASTGYLRSADDSLGKMMPANLTSQQRTVATSELPLGAPQRSAGVKSVTVKEISDNSGGSMRLVKTRYGDNKEFTSMVVNVRGNNGNVVPMTMPVPNGMMALPEKVAVSDAKGYVGQALGKMDNYEILYKKSAAQKANIYATYKNKPPIGEAEANPGVVGGNSRILPDRKPSSTRGGQLESLGIERAADDVRSPAAQFDNPGLIGQPASAMKGDFTPKTLEEMADRRVSWVLKEHSEFSAISSADNRKFMDLAARAEKGEAKESFFVTENAVLKRLNDDVVKDKDFVTALDNLHKDVLLREIQKDPVLKDAVVASYNDYKSIGFALKKNDANVRRLLDEKIAKTNQGFDDFLKKVEVAKGWKEKSIGLASDMRTWHHSGIGKTFQEAGLAARRSRELALDSGQARLVNFADESTHYLAATDRMSARSTELAQKFKSHGFLEKTPHGTALSEEAIETIRKAKPLGKSEDDMNRAVSSALQKRYGKEVSLEESALLRAQLKDIDAVNPSLLIEKRVEINMGLHDEGVVSFDFKGQNSRNLYQTQMAILKSKGKDIKARLEAIAEGDRIATAQLDDMKARVEKAVSSLGEKYVGKDVSKVVQKSGDDGIFHPLAELGPAEKAKLAKALNEQKVGDSVRLTYLPKNYRNSKEMIPVVDRNRLVVEAEKIEKDLFTEHLVGELPDEVFKGMQVKVDLLPAKEGKSAVGLTFSHASGKQIPAKAEEIARRVLDKKYDISYVDRPSAAGRAPAAAASGAKTGGGASFSPIKISNEVDSARVYATHTEIVEKLDKMGVKTVPTGMEPALKAIERDGSYGSAIKVKPIAYTDGSMRPYYGEVLVVDKLPPAAAKSTSASPAFTHPEMASYLKKMRAMGYDLATDTSQGYVSMRAYFYPGDRIISLAPHSSWADFVHEYQHLEFYETITKGNKLELFKNVRLGKGESLVKYFDPEFVKSVGADKLRKIQSLLDRGVTEENAINESLSVAAELESMGWRRYVPRSGGGSAYRYMLRHQITDLEALGPAMTDQQKKLVRSNKIKHAISEKMDKKSSLYAAGAIAAGGSASAGIYAYTKIMEEEPEQIFYDSQGRVIMLLKDGTLKYR